MKIAVLISTYNGHSFLDAQLESLSRQTVLDNMMLFIRDDGSSDDTIDIIEKWKKTMKIVVYKKNNIGPAMSFWELLMNTEIHADYYAFCDQDDIWDSDKLEVAISKLKNNVDLYTCNCRIINEKEQIIKSKYLVRSPDFSIKSLFIMGGTQGCSMVFTDALRKSLISMNINCIPMHDEIVLLYASALKGIYWDANPHFGYREHSNNVVAKKNKSNLEKLKTTYWNWKNGSKNSMSKVASEMLKNCTVLSEEDEKFLRSMSNYRNSLINKIKVTFDPSLKGRGRSIISFKLRIWLNLF